MTDIKEIFKQKEIKGIVFDLDGTFIDTYNLMLEYQRKNSIKIVNYINKKYKQNINTQEFIKIFNQTEREEYTAGNVSFILKFPDIIKKICMTLNLEIDQEELIDRFILDVGSIYYMTPEPFEGALETLHRFGFTKIVICTHSGKDWSILKTDYLNKLYKEKYNENLNFKLHYIPLDKPKDSNEWIKAYEEINEQPRNLIAVGDSFNSDILPAAKAEYKNLVWITDNGKDKQQDLDELEKLGHNTMIIDHIKNLNEITLNQLFEGI